MNPKVAVIHTSPVTVGPITALLEKALPGVEVVDFVDDTVLPRLADNGGDVAEVQPRLLDFARQAEAAGADAILSACSSVGELAAVMRDIVGVPVVRIDDAMTDEAITRGNRVGVAATVPTTVKPTLALLEDKARTAGLDIRFDVRVATDAFKLLTGGDAEGHDRLLIAMLQDMAATNDVVVLAQASMARVLSKLSADQRERFLTSPALAVGRVAQVLSGEGSQSDHHA